MEDEVTKHTKKIYAAVKNRSHTWSEKLREVMIEIFIIVFAVSLSIWLHGWSEHRHEQQNAHEFLSGLKEDISKDILLLQKNRNTISQLESNYRFMLEVIPTRTENAALSKEIHHRLVYKLTYTHLNIARYDGFKSSGKIETIENDSLKENILVFYQQTLSKITDMEVLLNSIQSKILDLDEEKNKKASIVDFVTASKLQSLFEIGAKNFEVAIQYYDEAIKQSAEIISAIEKETN